MDSAIDKPPTPLESGEIDVSLKPNSDPVPDANCGKIIRPIIRIWQSIKNFFMSSKQKVLEPSNIPQEMNSTTVRKRTTPLKRVKIMKKMKPAVPDSKGGSIRTKKSIAQPKKKIVKSRKRKIPEPPEMDSTFRTKKIRSVKTTTTLAPLQELKNPDPVPDSDCEMGPTVLLPSMPIIPSGDGTRTYPNFKELIERLRADLLLEQSTLNSTTKPIAKPKCE